MFKVIILITMLIILGAVLNGCSNTGTSDQSVSLSYEEIKQNVERITKKEEHPEGPEIGLDGLVDKQIEEDLVAYQNSIVGIRVDGWQGWYNTATEYGPEKNYNVSILMEEPQPGVHTFTDVLIYGVPPEVVSTLQEGQRVVFTSTISGVNLDGSVALTYIAITAMKQGGVIFPD